MWVQLREWTHVVVHQPLLFLLIVLVSGSAGVLYTVGPLHDTKNWRIDYLDTQLTMQQLRVRDLEDSLSRRDLDADGKLTAPEASELNRELAEAKAERDHHEQRAGAAAQRAAEAQRSREHWRSKSRDAEAELALAVEEQAALRAERASLLERLSAVGSQSAPPPAAVAEGSTVLASSLELMVGESWSSPDGRVSFEVIDVDKRVASLRGSWQSNAAGPERVSAGHELTEKLNDTIYRISVTAVSPYRSVTIRAVSGPS